MPTSKWLKIPAAPGACCDCESMTSPCDCIQLECNFQCQSKTGVATLCGWPEFGTPSSPPKKYRKRDVQGSSGPQGKMLHCEIPGSDCTISIPCPRSKSWSGSNAGATGSGYLVWTGTSGGDSTYVAYGNATFGDGTPANVRITINFVGQYYPPPAQNITIPNGTWEVSFDVEVAGFWYNLGGGCIDTNAPLVTITEDIWQESEHYDKTTCVQTTDTNNDGRLTGSSSACVDIQSDPTATGGPLLCDTPADCYGTFANVTTPTPYERQTDGVGCIDHGNGTSTMYQGTIIEALSDEDLPKDAMARAEASIAWQGTDCFLYPAFITGTDSTSYSFAFRDVQVKATAGALPFTPLTIGHTYELTIGWYRRPLGVGGDWIFYGSDVVTINATHTTETTDWIDVPNDVGYETRPQSCAVRDVTPP